jgi:cobalt-zinc-cadmium efflux system outer membrane protein
MQAYLKTKIPALAWVLSLAWPTAVIAGDTASVQGGGPLSALVREALDKNPSLQAARLEADAAHANAGQRRAWDPPQVGIEFFETPLASFPNPIRNQRETDYFLQQSIPFPGKRGAMAESERWRGRSGEERARALADEVARDVKTAWYGLCLADARLRSNAEGQEVAQRMIGAARKQYELGLGRQADILRAQAEWTALRNEALSLEEERQAMAGALNALLDRPADGVFPATEDLRPAPLRWTYAELKPWAEARHPALKALDAERSMRDAEVGAARKEFLPDLMVKGAYKSMGDVPEGMHGAAAPEDSWSLMIGVDVPVAPWSAPKYRAGYRIAKLNRDRAGRERKAAANRVDAEMRAALAKTSTAWRQWELAGDALLPQAEQALQSTLSAYQTGKGDFQELMDAYRGALSARLERHMAAARVMQGRAELERAVGMDLDSIPVAAAAARGKS